MSITLSSAVSILSAFPTSFQTAQQTAKDKIKSLRDAKQVYYNLVASNASSSSISAQSDIVATLTNEQQVACNYCTTLLTTKAKAEQIVLASQGVGSSVPTSNPFVGVTGPTGPTGPAWSVTLDNIPTPGSNNPLSSGGAYQALDSISLGSQSSSSVAVATSTGSYDPKVKMLFHLDGQNGSTNFPDSSSNNVYLSGNFGDLNTAKLTTSIKKFGTSCLDLTTSSSSTVITLDTVLLFPGYRYYTVQFWFNVKSTPCVVFSPNNTPVIYGSGSTLLYFGGGTLGTLGTSGTTYLLNTWYFATVTYDANTGQIQPIYINGVSRSPTFTFNNTSLYAPFAVGFGRVYGTATVSASNVYIDDIRVCAHNTLTEVDSTVVPTAAFPDPTPNFPASGTQGQLWTDGVLLYLCTATGTPGTWKRILTQ